MVQNLFENNFDMIRNECYNIDNKKVLPITTVRLIIYLVKITVQFPGWGGYFFVVLLPLEPIAYPRPNEVKQRLSTAIKVSTVSISEVLLPSDFSNESISM